MLLEPFTLAGVTFRNRLLRSSVGGRMAHYDGTVGSVWKNFEKTFADGGVGGVISTTLDVNRWRESPFEYPPICDDRFVAPLKRAIKQVQETGCRYIVQIGDPGYHTQTSLFPQRQDGLSSSSGLDLIYGYGARVAMTEDDIRASIEDFAQGAVRAQDTGADGLEVTASKGYLIHQFLNPGINRRKDAWGGSLDNRFRLLGEIVKEIRARVGRDFLFGIRLAAFDDNRRPVNLRWPPVWRRRRGSTIEETLEYGRRLKALGVDYLHIDSGFGFPHPRVTPGAFPYDEVRLFFDATRHLSRKASFRATMIHLVPRFLGRWLSNRGWEYQEAINLELARRFKSEIGLPTIANGGFQRRSTMDQALASGACDLLAVARALIANPDLPKTFAAGKDAPERPCTYCNRCIGRTTTSPLGCYEPKRFDSVEAMEEQILALNRPDPPPDGD